MATAGSQDGSSPAPANGKGVGDGPMLSPGSTQVQSRAAQAVPKPAKTGHQLTDEKNQSNYLQTQQLVDEIVRDPSLTAFLWTKIAERKKKMTMNAFEGQSFKKQHHSLKKLIEEEAEWVVLYIASVSDLNPPQLLEMSQKDSEVLEKLISVDTQLSSSCRLPPEFMNKDLMWAFLNHSSFKFGQRLKGFAKKVQPDASVNWSAVIYELTWSRDTLKSVKHKPTGVSVDVATLGLPRTYKMQSPWLDHGAQLVLPPIAPTRVASMFGRRQGPNTIEDPMKPATLKRNVQTVVLKFDEDRKKNSATAAAEAGADKVAAAKVAEKMDAKRKGEQNQRMTALRERAAAGMANKRAKTTFQC